MLYPIRMSLLCSQSSVPPAAAGQGQMGLPGSDPLKLDTEPDKFTAGAICLRYAMRQVSQKVRRDPDLFNGQGQFGREREKCSQKKSVYRSWNMCCTAGQSQSIAVSECYCRYCSSSLICHSGLEGSSYRAKPVTTEMLQKVVFF